MKNLLISLGIGSAAFLYTQFLTLRKNVKIRILNAGIDTTKTLNADFDKLHLFLQIEFFNPTLINFQLKDLVLNFKLAGINLGNAYKTNVDILKSKTTKVIKIEIALHTKSIKKALGRTVRNFFLGTPLILVVNGQVNTNFGELPVNEKINLNAA
jgi:LEA14-like dessication related protein